MVAFKLGSNALAALRPANPIFHLDSEELFLDKLSATIARLDTIEATLEMRLQNLEKLSERIFEKVVSENSFKEEITKILNKQGTLVDKLSDVYSRLGVIEGTLDAIFADMVGEGTFAAAIVELNLAIGGVGTAVATGSTSIVAAIQELVAISGGSSAAVVAAIAAQTVALQSSIGGINDNVTAEARESREALGFQQEETRGVIRSVNNEVIESNRLLGLLESIAARLLSEMAVLLAFQQDIKNNTRIIDNSLFVTNNYLEDVSTDMTRIRNDVEFIQDLLQGVAVINPNIGAFRVIPV